MDQQPVADGHIVFRIHGFQQKGRRTLLQCLFRHFFGNTDGMVFDFRAVTAEGFHGVIALKDHAFSFEQFQHFFVDLLHIFG